MGSGCERNRVRLVAVLMACLLFSTVFYGCGGGGGGSTTVTAPQYGAIEGYVYAPIGSGARVAEAVPAGKKAVQGATVSVTCGATQKNATTNSSGYFKITSLPTGSCSMTVTFSGFGVYYTKVKVLANSTSSIGGGGSITLSLATSGSITVTANVSGGTVFIDGEDTGVTIPTGLTYTFDGIAPGEHTVSISQSGYDAVTELDVDVSEGQGAATSFALNPTGNSAPVADAGEDFKGFAGTRYIYEGWNGTMNIFTPAEISVELDGSASVDSDGDVLQYTWAQTSGASVTLNNTVNATTSFIPIYEGEYTFQLLVNDGYLTSEPDTVTVSVAKPSGKLTFSTGFKETSPEIFTMNVDGSNLTQLNDDLIDDSHAHWSPDGTRIGYSADDGTDTYLALINSDGTGQNTTGIEYGVSDWFSDNEILAYKYYSGFIDFYRVNIDGTNEQRLTFSDERGVFAKISPDGSKIAYAKNYGGDNYEVVVMDSDGSNITRLTNNTTTETYLTWLDDNRIVYETSNYIGDKTRGLYMMDADGTNVAQIPLPSGLTEINSNITSSTDGQFIFLKDQNSYLHIMFADGSASMSYGIWGSHPDYHPGP